MGAVLALHRPDGLLKQFTTQVLETALNQKMTAVKIGRSARTRIGTAPGESGYPLVAKGRMA